MMDLQSDMMATLHRGHLTLYGATDEPLEALQVVASTVSPTASVMPSPVGYAHVLVSDSHRPVIPESHSNSQRASALVGYAHVLASDSHRPVSPESHSDSLCPFGGSTASLVAGSPRAESQVVVAPEPPEDSDNPRPVAKSTDANGFVPFTNARAAAAGPKRTLDSGMLMFFVHCVCSLCFLFCHVNKNRLYLQWGTCVASKQIHPPAAKGNRETQLSPTSDQPIIVHIVCVLYPFF